MQDRIQRCLPATEHPSTKAHGMGLGPTLNGLRHADVVIAPLRSASSFRTDIRANEAEGPEGVIRLHPPEPRRMSALRLPKPRSGQAAYGQVPPLETIQIDGWRTFSKPSDGGAKPGSRPNGPMGSSFHALFCRRRKTS